MHSSVRARVVTTALGGLFAALSVSSSTTAAQSKPPKPDKKSTAPAKPSKKEARAASSEDALLRARFERLSPSDRQDVADAFALAASHLDTFQASLIRDVLRRQTRDSGLWPLASKAPVFDPREHAPAQAIARRWLESSSTTAARFAERVFADVPERTLASAWRYDYASRAIVRSPDVKDPARIFHNGLAGFPPDLDLCEALVEQELDDDAQSIALAAFAHAYTDRDGAVYPGVTLYDAWASGEEIEMPDVDTLGIVHSVLKDWKTWVAPVSAAQHDELYGEIERLFRAAHRHRGLRHALARTYFVGDAVLRDGYEANLDNFHALWETASSRPAELAKKLPDDKGWSKFLDQWNKELKRKAKLRQAGANRRWTLSADAAKVRRLAVLALDEITAPTAAGGNPPTNETPGERDHRAR